MKIQRIVQTKSKKYRFRAIFEGGLKVQFGKPGQETFIDNANALNQRVYRQQNKHKLGSFAPVSPFYLEWYLLWSYSDLVSAVNKYNMILMKCSQDKKIPTCPELSNRLDYKKIVNRDKMHAYVNICRNQFM